MDLVVPNFQIRLGHFCRSLGLVVLSALGVVVQIFLGRGETADLRLPNYGIYGKRSESGLLGL